jgi:hypothetical protein
MGALQFHFLSVSSTSPQTASTATVQYYGRIMPNLPNYYHLLGRPSLAVSTRQMPAAWSHIAPAVHDTPPLRSWCLFCPLYLGPLSIAAIQFTALKRSRLRRSTTFFLLGGFFSLFLPPILSILLSRFAVNRRKRRERCSSIQFKKWHGEDSRLLCTACSLLLLDPLSLRPILLK